ncbi:hypothetical protein BDP27DRAFT_1474550 [Rhodocollybia butyracea]|uniref:Uncharacterized protein n=1 Tax=Rhodocollybia butyracea TaxID=206335 RepID=A0A9P5PIS8_9AGAR|nr:hypothetical protein BDP27DRAFT_1474550 [Rhodocollybia butyracea]
MQRIRVLLDPDLWTSLTLSTDYLLEKKEDIKPDMVLSKWKVAVNDLEHHSKKWKNPAPSNKLSDVLSHYDNTHPVKCNGSAQPSQSSQSSRAGPSSSGSNFRFPPLKGHKSSGVDTSGNLVCPNVKLDVPWCPLTAEMAAFATKAHEKTKQPILYGALLKQFPAPVASVTVVGRGLPLADLSGVFSNTEVSPPAALVNANPYRSFPVGFIQHDLDMYPLWGLPNNLAQKSMRKR